MIAFAATLSTAMVLASVALEVVPVNYVVITVLAALALLSSASSPEAVGATAFACAIALSIAHSPWLWVCVIMSSN